MSLLARRTDPETSLWAAKKATADAKVAQTVALIMADGVSRTDEEIYDAQTGDKHSPSRIRHGRKYLSDLGELVDTKERRRTREGGLSRVWRKN